MKGTRGTETSKYPEEKKETSIPKVAASEIGRAQTRGFRIFGVWTDVRRKLYRRTRQESRTEEGKSPVF